MFGHIIKFRAAKDGKKCGKDLDSVKYLVLSRKPLDKARSGGGHLL
jgi:hypothetical protein